MSVRCDHAPAIEAVGPMLHVTCQCGLDYWVQREVSS